MFRTKVVEKIKTHVLFLVAFFVFLAVYKKKLKKVVEPGRQHMTV
jgi:hypothetical protein